jgi:hypothetical protein
LDERPKRKKEERKMEDSETKFLAFVCTVLIFSPPFVNAGLWQLRPEVLVCLRSHEMITKTIVVEGETYTFPVSINKTYIIFKNGTRIYNAFVETELVKINYTKVMPCQDVQGSSISPAGSLVRDWYDGLLFIYDCPLNSIYYPHPDHYYTYPDQDHLMMWNYPWNITGNTMNHIHITQDEILRMKAENTILPETIKRALISAFGSLVIGSIVVPKLLSFLTPLVGTVIGQLIVAIVLFVIWLIVYLIADSVQTPTVAEWVEQKVELYHHDGFMWTWGAQRRVWGVELGPPLEYSIPGGWNWYMFFAVTFWHYIKFACAFGKELREGTVHYFDVFFGIPWKYYITLG